MNQNVTPASSTFDALEVEVMLNTRQRGKMPPEATPADWRRFHRGFVRRRLTARQLTAAIHEGHPFAPLYHGRRIKANFVATWHLALDFDTGDHHSALATLANDEFAWLFAAFAYTTPSSTPAAPRSRLVFLFPTNEPITEAADYERLYRALLWRFPHADPSPRDALRLFYGSPGCDLWLNWSILPAAARPALLTPPIPNSQLPMDTSGVLSAHSPLPTSGVLSDHYPLSTLHHATTAIHTAPPGQRHDTLLRAAIALGRLAATPSAPFTAAELHRALLESATWATTPAARREVTRVIRDGLRYAAYRPHPTLPHPSELLTR